MPAGVLYLPFIAVGLLEVIHPSDCAYHSHDAFGGISHGLIFDRYTWPTRRQESPELVLILLQ